MAAGSEQTPRDRCEAHSHAYALLSTNLHVGAQNVAIGLIGEPVPPTTGSGAALNMNSHRLRAAAACASASRSQLSNSGMPSVTRAKSCTAFGISDFDGFTPCG